MFVSILQHGLDWLIYRLFRLRHGDHGIFWIKPDKVRYFPLLDDEVVHLRADGNGAGIEPLIPGIYEYRIDGHLYRTAFQTVRHGVVTSHSTRFLEDSEFASAFEEGLALYPGAESERLNLSHKVYTVASLAKQAAQFPGDLLEIGVSWGVYAHTIAAYADLPHRPDRRLLLVDAWQGRYSHSKDRESDADCDDYCTNEALIRDSFSHLPNVEIVQGIAPEILKTIQTDGFSFVHLDIGYDESTEIAILQAIIPRCRPGAVIIVNSCFLNEGYSRNFDKALDEMRVSVTGTVQAQGIIIVPPASTHVTLKRL